MDMSLLSAMSVLLIIIFNKHIVRNSGKQNETDSVYLDWRCKVYDNRLCRGRDNNNILYERVNKLYISKFYTFLKERNLKYQFSKYLNKKYWLVNWEKNGVN